MSPLQRALIEKAGHDHGFEYAMPDDGALPEGVSLASARHPARVRVSVDGQGGYVVVVTRGTSTLAGELQRAFGRLAEAGATFKVPDDNLLAQFLQRAADLSRALPSQAAEDYEAEVGVELAKFPPGFAGTEVERVVRQRVGQNRFREALMDYWGGACAVTGVTVPEVLRASHAKPWADCDSDAERLDVFNGFLLTANLDALFDRFLISFDEAGELIVSTVLSAAMLQQLGLSGALRLRWVAERHQGYLEYHRRQLRMPPDT